MYIIETGFANNIHGMQRTATTTRNDWNPFCPLYIQGLHSLAGATPGLNNTMLINVINTDGAQKGPCAGSVSKNNNKYHNIIIL